MEYYIYNIPVWLTQVPQPGVDIPTFCQEVEEILPQALLRNVDVVYIGNFAALKDKNAAYDNGAIYMTCEEPTNFDMLENFVHETAHALEDTFGWQIYDDSLIKEFKGKRERLYQLLKAAGFPVNHLLFKQTEYNKKFDEYLAFEIGYADLAAHTMGLFVTPYGATSIQEYFANGFEQYFLDNPLSILKTSPILYQKIESILNEA
jgi:hypothetical protein|tara:strand:- start:13 stop:627 length:615 start_codon:yes stop_codon:yes gene_type:complete